MRKIMLSGCNGRMGRCVTELCSASSDISIAAGIDINAVKLSDYPVYANPIEFTGAVDVVVDFSSPRQLESLLSYCLSRRVPIVIATTGYSERQLADIKVASGQIPLFRSANMSLGVSLLADLASRAAQTLKQDFDIEIIERHHRMKKDAPSGTALMLLDSVKKSLPYEPEPVYDRHKRSGEREKDEIGMHSVRGGSIIGEHEIVFAGAGETITLSHSAVSREVFASGALHAARFMASGVPAGMYDMKDITGAAML